MIFHIDETTPKQVFDFLKQNKHYLPDGFMDGMKKSLVYNNYPTFFCLACNISDLAYVNSLIRNNQDKKPKCSATRETKLAIIQRYVTLIGDLK